QRIELIAQIIEAGNVGKTERARAGLDDALEQGDAVGPTGAALFLSLARLIADGLGLVKAGTVHDVAQRTAESRQVFAGYRTVCDVSRPGRGRGRQQIVLNVGEQGVVGRKRPTR